MFNYVRIPVTWNTYPLILVDDVLPRDIFFSLIHTLTIEVLKSYRNTEGKFTDLQKAVKQNYTQANKYNLLDTGAGIATYCK